MAKLGRGLTPEEIDDFEAELEDRIRTGRGYFASLSEMKYLLYLLQQQQPEQPEISSNEFKRAFSEAGKKAAAKSLEQSSDAEETAQLAMQAEKHFKQWSANPDNIALSLYAWAATFASIQTAPRDQKISELEQQIAELREELRVLKYNAHEYAKYQSIGHRARLMEAIENTDRFLKTLNQ